MGNDQMDSASVNRRLEMIEMALDDGDLVAAQHHVRSTRLWLVDAVGEQTPPSIIGGVALTGQEMASLRLLPDGSMGQKDMARAMGVTRNTLKTHLKSLYLKLGAHSRAEAIDRARELGLLQRRQRDVAHGRQRPRRFGDLGMSTALTADPSAVAGEGRPFEWWMTSNFAMGASFSAFMALLIPPYVTEVTSDAAAAGAVMAVISLAAVLGPVLGTFADRHGAHRIVMTLGVFGMALGFAAFALASEDFKFFAIDSLILGVSAAAVAAVGPVFVVGAGLSRALEAKRMTWYSLAMPAGQVAGGALVGAAAAAGWSFSDRFWIASVFCVAAGAVTWMTSKGAEERLHAVMYAEAEADAEAEAEADAGPDAPSKPTVSLKAVMWSSFGLFLVVTTLTSVANNGINSQISNIMPNVYGVSEAETSTLISAAGVLNIVLFVVAGKMMASRGKVPTYSLGVIMRLVGALGMALVGLMTDAPALLGIAFMQILYQANPFARLAQPGVAVRFATFPAGIANGWLIAGSALGGFIGSLLGGVLADRYGFNAVSWMGAVGAGLSVVVLVMGVLPQASRDADSDASPDPEAEPVPQVS